MKMVTHENGGEKILTVLSVPLLLIFSSLLNTGTVWEGRERLCLVSKRYYSISNCLKDCLHIYFYFLATPPSLFYWTLTHISCWHSQPPPRSCLCCVICERVQRVLLFLINIVITILSCRHNLLFAIYFYLLLFATMVKQISYHIFFQMAKIVETFIHHSLQKFLILT